jgi:DNA-binding protein HU-beta
MKEVKVSLEKGENVYLRGFGSFIIKTRAEKTGRNISQNTALKIPAHNIPAFKPAKVFVEGVKTNVKVK